MRRKRHCCEQQDEYESPDGHGNRLRHSGTLTGNVHGVNPTMPQCSELTAPDNVG